MNLMQHILNVAFGGLDPIPATDTGGQKDAETSEESRSKGRRRRRPDIIGHRRACRAVRPRLVISDKAMGREAEAAPVRAEGKKENDTPTQVETKGVKKGKEIAPWGAEQAAARAPYPAKAVDKKVWFIKCDSCGESYDALSTGYFIQQEHYCSTICLQKRGN